MKIAITVMASFAATFACATAASAASTENPFARDKVILQLSDLDLTTADGQQRLAIRMGDAANAVCGDRVASVHLALEQKARECRAAVLADIRLRIETRTAEASQTAQVRLASAR